MANLVIFYSFRRLFPLKSFLAASSACLKHKLLKQLTSQMIQLAISPTPDQAEPTGKKRINYG